MRLFVGGHCAMIAGERYDLAGDRMFTASHKPERHGFDPSQVIGLLDSGAFTDSPARRLTPEAALDRQLRWEGQASEKWGHPWQAHGLVSYDLLIDETWSGDERTKRRWSLTDAERAVATTVDAAYYLASRRERLAPRLLILSCQGVDAGQYRECVDAVLAVATPADWIGLGGWCILGRQQRWLPEFWATLHACLPRIAARGIRNVHIFGVLWQRALGGLVWLADQHGLTVSTDSTAPVLACTWKDHRKAGARERYWRDNVNYWVGALAGLRESPWYRPVGDAATTRQLSLWGEGQ
ncbi:MAG TPA: hypothetical protein VGR57_21805 [Ktedonobacterales bacterium]|nr:hypothetical protein [Ktedonobacterales bacterium]